MNRLRSTFGAIIGAGLIGFVLVVGKMIKTSLLYLFSLPKRWILGRDLIAGGRHDPRRSFKRGILVGVLGVVILSGLLGTFVLLSGIMSLKASSGHWPITHWFLNFGKERYVATYSLGVKEPFLDDPSLVLKGALHYDIGCRSCHGSPEMQAPRIPQQMTAKPPYLPPRIKDFKARELFYIVKHGIKFTGMPGWPSQKRDDEVWAVVAFLLKLPNLDAEGYRELVGVGSPPTAPIETLDLKPETVLGLTYTCASCHGHDGIGRGDGSFPHLAGQREEYLKNSLKAYIRGNRHSGIMEPIAAGLDDELIDEMARYYANLSPPQPRTRSDVDPEVIALGESIASKGLPDDRVPSCIECHEPEGRKAKDAYPSLAGQPAEYLKLQLELFQKENRGGSDYAHLMHHVINHLEPDEIEALSFYFESIPLPVGRASNHDFIQLR